MKNLILPEQMNAPVLCALFKWKYRFNAIECVSMHFIFFGIFFPHEREMLLKHNRPDV